jgi:hypothetical protein
MKNIAIAFLTIVLCAAPSVHAQRIADVPTKNSCGILTPVVDTMNTFVPDRPSRVQQDSISYVMGTDVRSTSLRTDRPTDVPEDFGSWTRGTKQEKTLSSDTLSCGQLYEAGLILASPDGEFYAAGDTLKYYVEHCYSYAGFNPGVFGLIDDDFSSSGPNGNYPSDGDTLPNLLQWFFNVLYLDTDTQYYCSDASAALGCLQAMYAHDSSIHANPMNGAAGWAAVEKYVIESGKCQPYQTQFENSLSAVYASWYRIWKDTVTDSLLTPWDTTNLPTLQQIGFEALLGNPSAVANNGTLPTSVLGTISVTPNPFEDNAVVDYTLNVPATLTVEVYNVLGQRVLAPVPSVFTAYGNHSLTLSGSALASGTYYVRFSVPEGEVQTVKLVKE